MDSILDDADEMFMAINRSIEAHRDAICRPGIPWGTPDGGKVGDLTEAVIYVGQSIGSMAAALERIAEAIEMK